MKKIILLGLSTFLLGCSSVSEIGDQLSEIAGKLITIEGCHGQNCQKSTLYNSTKHRDKTIKLICQNLFREYLVSYNQQYRTLILNSEKGDTEYTVLAIESNGKTKIIAGSTVNGGPTFKLSLPQNGKPKFDFYIDKKLEQTDLCRYI